jgi:hypothetical protein
MPGLGFQVQHTLTVLDDGEVALLENALRQQDPQRVAGAAAGELLRRIEAAAALDQTPPQQVEIDDEVAAILVGAISYIQDTVGATDEMLRLRSRAQTLTKRGV